MFGGSKSTFGQAQPTQPFGFTNSQQTASPFAQSAFGKPATTTFGQPTSAFGQQPNTSSVFGTPQQPAGLFGSAATPAFGATPTTQSSFGGRCFLCIV